MKGRYFNESIISRHAEKKAWKTTIKVMNWLKKQGIKFTLDQDYYEDALMEVYDSISSKELCTWLLPSRSTGWQLRIYLHDRNVSIIYSPSTYSAEKGLLEVANLALSGTFEADEGVVALGLEEILNRINSVQFGDGPYAANAFAPETIEVL